MNGVSKEVVDKAVGIINGWLADLSRDNNNFMRDIDPDAKPEWAEVRIACLVSSENINEGYLNSTYLSGSYLDGIYTPSHVTAGLIIGTHDYMDNDWVSINGYIFPVTIEDDNIILCESIDEVFGGGPIYNDGYNIDECVEWILERVVSGDNTIYKYDESDMTTVQLF